MSRGGRGLGAQATTSTTAWANCPPRDTGAAGPHRPDPAEDEPQGPSSSNPNSPNGRPRGRLVPTRRHPYTLGQSVSRPSTPVHAGPDLDSCRTVDTSTAGLGATPQSLAHTTACHRPPNPRRSAVVRRQEQCPATAKPPQIRCTPTPPPPSCTDPPLCPWPPAASRAAAHKN